MKVIKGYYKFNENDNYERYADFTLAPLNSGLSIKTRTSNHIPKTVKQMYLKFFLN
jgi:hypothetical protein